MRILITTFILFFSFLKLVAQEFTLYENGLIYNKQTMDRLKVIVDSLNQKHVNCIVDKPLFAAPFAKAHFIEINGEKVNEVKNEMDNNISFYDFEIKYPNVFIDHNLLVTKNIYNESHEDNYVIFSSLPLGQDNEHQIRIQNDKSFYEKKLKGKWVYDYYKGDKYSNESLIAFYFIEEFQTPLIPKNYSNLIQYSDCIIDTNTQIYTDGAIQRADYRYNITKRKGPSKLDLFENFVNKKTNKPDYEFDYEDTAASNKFYSDYSIWDSLKIEIIKEKYLNNKEFLKLFNDAIAEATKEGNSNDLLEEFVTEFNSKEKSLELKRNRIVNGTCSMDNSPRNHAKNIALLSAETANWGVFIKSHLNIMNDRFNRISDGSYAFGLRQTYIKELEELNINVDIFLLGSIFRINNPSKNHYFGDISRIGRAFSEYSNKDILEKELVDIIEDNNLDDYNRLLFYFVFKNYNYFLQDSIRQIDNENKLKIAVSKFPSYISVRINSKFYQVEQLLNKEIDTIKKYFDIVDAKISSISSIDFDGSCWEAILHDKNIEDNLNFEITMDTEPTLVSIKTLLEKKDDIIKRVQKASFLIKHVNEDKKRKLEIRFVNDKSFSKIGQKSFKDDFISKKNYNKYSKYLDDTILLSLTNENGWSRWLIFPNGEIMLWHYSGNPPLDYFIEEQIKTTGGIFNNSLKIFKEDGKIIR